MVWHTYTHTYSSVQSLSPVQIYALPHIKLPCPSPNPGACSNSCPLSRWCHPTISFFVVPFSSCLQYFPASGSFPMSPFFTSGGQNIEASPSVLPMKIQDWFPLGLTGLISLQSKGLSRVFSNITVQKHQFFGAQLSIWSISHIHTWLHSELLLSCEKEGNHFIRDNMGRLWGHCAKWNLSDRKRQIMYCYHLSLGWEDPLEKEMAIHCSILAWRMPWTIYIVHGVAKSQTWLSDFHFQLSQKEVWVINLKIFHIKNQERKDQTQKWNRW